MTAAFRNSARLLRQVADLMPKLCDNKALRASEDTWSCSPIGLKCHSLRQFPYAKPELPIWGQLEKKRMKHQGSFDGTRSKLQGNLSSFPLLAATSPALRHNACKSSASKFLKIVIANPVARNRLRSCFFSKLIVWHFLFFDSKGLSEVLVLAHLHRSVLTQSFRKASAHFRWCLENGYEFTNPPHIILASSIFQMLIKAALHVQSLPVPNTKRRLLREPCGACNSTWAFVTFTAGQTAASTRRDMGRL